MGTRRQISHLISFLRHKIIWKRFFADLSRVHQEAVRSSLDEAHNAFKGYRIESLYDFDLFN